MSKRPFGPLESDKVILRPLEEADLPLTLAWRNKDRVRSEFFTSRVLTSEEHRAWFEAFAAKDDDFVFVILDRSLANRPVGQVAIYRIDWLSKSAEFGRLMIGEEDALGKGLASGATRLMLYWAYRELGLRTIYLEVFRANDRAILIYERCGFVSIRESDDRILMEARCRRESRR